MGLLQIGHQMALHITVFSSSSNVLFQSYPVTFCLLYEQKKAFFSCALCTATQNNFNIYTHWLSLFASDVDVFLVNIFLFVFFLSNIFFFCCSSSVLSVDYFAMLLAAIECSYDSFFHVLFWL